MELNSFSLNSLSFCFEIEQWILESMFSYLARNLDPPASSCQ